LIPDIDEVDCTQSNDEIPVPKFRGRSLDADDHQKSGEKFRKNSHEITEKNESDLQDKQTGTIYQLSNTGL
jgi:hypothetical protein